MGRCLAGRISVKPEIAHDENAVLDRISGTVRLKVDRFMPKIQRWRSDRYRRCIDRMPFILEYLLVGIDRMCRRHVHGRNSVLRIVDELARAFAGTPVRLHGFGLKTRVMHELRGHPRISSVDSQALGPLERVQV